jgi:hypothetical protein
MGALESRTHHSVFLIIFSKVPIPLQQQKDGCDEYCPENEVQD